LIFNTIIDLNDFGDKILMTEGAGGGTITTTAIYSGNHDVVKETMNIKFLEACELLLNSEYLKDNELNRVLVARRFFDAARKKTPPAKAVYSAAGRLWKTRIVLKAAAGP